MSIQPVQSNGDPTAGREGRPAHGGVGVHYLAGGVTLSLVLLVFYVFVFEAEPPPFLEEEDLRVTEGAQVAGDRPRVVIEEVDFGEEVEIPEELTAKMESVTSPAATEGSQGAGADDGAPAAGEEEESPAAAQSPSPEEAPVSEGGDSPQGDAAEVAAASDAAPPPEGDFVIQVIATRSAQNAQRIADEIGRAGMRTHIGLVEREGENLHRVRVGPFVTRSDAEIARRDLAEIGYEDADIIDLR